MTAHLFQDFFSVLIGAFSSWLVLQDFFSLSVICSGKSDTHFRCWRLYKVWSS